MASIYPRGRKLWAMVGKGKNRRAIATGFAAGQEEQALRAAEAVEAEIEAGTLRPFELGPLTVEKYAREWIADRKDATSTALTTTRAGSSTRSRSWGP